MVKKITLTLFVSVLLDASWIEDNMIQSGTDTGYYKTQTRGLYTLGSKRIRFKNQNIITPVHIEIPRINIGCNGIDIGFGGFSYLNEEYLIEKLKAISSAAPAFAYQLAISTLCKDCQNIANELEKIANMINGLNFDTCQATNMGMAAGKKLGEAMNQQLFQGDSDDWMEQTVKDAGDTMQGWITSLTPDMGSANNAKEAIDIITLKGSLLNNALTTGNSKLTDAQLKILEKDEKGDYLLISSMRAMAGDMIGSTSQEGVPIMRIISSGIKINYLNNFLYGGRIQTISFKNGKVEALSSEKFKGVKEIYQIKIKSILDSMKSKTKITNADRSFLSGLPVPIYKYLNISVLSRAGDSDVELLSEYIAILETQELVNYIASLISKSITTFLHKNSKDYTQEEITMIKSMSQELDYLASYTDAMTATKMAKWSDKKSLNDYYKKLDQEVKAKLANNGIYQSYLWTKGLGY